MATAALVTRTEKDADRDLVERHRYGDETAFDEVYALFGTMVYNLALRMLGNEADASDCAQETFLRVHRHLGGFRGRSGLKTWVFRIALNCCRTRVRRRMRRRRFLDFGRDDLVARAADRDRDPEEQAAARETSRAVHDALAAVKPVYREAVLLRDLHGFTYEEIATVLGVRIGTVRSRIARGRDELRRVMESEE
jgi:RNA polymerase sigma-70 factor (ECF subfamily)